MGMGVQSKGLGPGLGTAPGKPHIQSNLLVQFLARSPRKTARDEQTRVVVLPTPSMQTVGSLRFNTCVLFFFCASQNSGGFLQLIHCFAQRDEPPNTQTALFRLSSIVIVKLIAWPASKSGRLVITYHYGNNPVFN